MPPPPENNIFHALRLNLEPSEPSSFKTVQYSHSNTVGTSNCLAMVDGLSTLRRASCTRNVAAAALTYSLVPRPSAEGLGTRLANIWNRLKKTLLRKDREGKAICFG